MIAFFLDRFPAGTQPSAGIDVIFFAANGAEAAFLQDALVGKDIALSGYDGDCGGGRTIFRKVVSLAFDGFPAVFDDFSFGIIVIDFFADGTQLISIGYFGSCADCYGCGTVDGEGGQNAGKKKCQQYSDKYFFLHRFLPQIFLIMYVIQYITFFM